MKKIIITVIVFVSFCGVLSAAGQLETVKEIGNANMSNKVLIATENTNFKNQLVEQLVAALNDNKTYIKIFFHKNVGIENEDPRNYDAFLIINSGQKSIVRPWITDFLNSVKDYNDNIILLTTIVLNWEPQVEVDSITSASDLQVIPDLVKTLTNKIRALF